MKNMLKKALVLTSLAFTLQGCFVVGVAAAGAAAITVVYDHRTIQSSVKDAELANKIFQKIRANARLRDDSHIEVAAFNGIVLLTGETPNPDWKQLAENITKTVPGIRRIYNQITIQGPTSSLTRTSDAWVTTKIKSQMLADSDFKPTSIKVITENGAVYLMGIVTPKQADRAVSIAREVTGVQKVIKVFQYKDKKQTENE